MKNTLLKYQKICFKDKFCEAKELIEKNVCPLNSQKHMLGGNADFPFMIQKMKLKLMQNEGSELDFSLLYLTW
jgi:hypothetical protein